ncbi:hypothetical protein T492DRAFT_842023 [Pavlovales sp. CCMP2436]|nr:hypothetical protein T492DRAFT_842023 [Pavlovales sp. CCMP2436]
MPGSSFATEYRNQYGRGGGGIPTAALWAWAKRRGIARSAGFSMRRGMSNNPFTTAAVAVSAAKRVFRGRAAPQSTRLSTAHARNAGIRTRKPRKSGTRKTPRSMARKSLKKTIRTVVRQEGTVHSKPPPPGGVQVWRPIMYGISSDPNKLAAITNAVVFTNDTMHGLNVCKTISTERTYPTLAEYQVGLARNKATIIGAVGITGTTELKLKLVKTSEAFKGISNVDGINFTKPSSYGTNDYGLGGGLGGDGEGGRRGGGGLEAPQTGQSTTTRVKYHFHFMFRHGLSPDGLRNMSFMQLVESPGESLRLSTL